MSVVVTKPGPGGRVLRYILGSKDDPDYKAKEDVMDVDADCSVGGCPNKVRISMFEAAMLHDIRKSTKTCAFHRFVRVSRGKPRVIRADDRWGRLTNSWYTNESGLITEEMWSRVQEYQTPDSFNAANVLAVVVARREDEDWDSWFKRWQESAQGLEFLRVLSLPGRPTTVWEFNAIHEMKGNETSYIRMVAMHWAGRDGGMFIERWNWFDYRVRHPLTKVLASMLSFFGRFLRDPAP